MGRISGPFGVKGGPIMVSPQNHDGPNYISGPFSENGGPIMVNPQNHNGPNYIQTHLEKIEAQ